VITIVGYSPYENLGELMDPPGVENDPSKWGFITRLLHLDDIVDGNSPFELYKKADVPKNFMLDIKPVSADATTPTGIGIADYKNGSGSYNRTEEQVLIDPMTKETISRVAALRADGQPMLDRSNNPVYETNDHWFTLNAKFVWRDSPVAPEQPVSSSRRSRSR